MVPIKEQQCQHQHPNLQNLENVTQMECNIPNNSPIPLVRTTTSQQRGATVPTSTNKPDRGACLNTSDHTHSRGKANILNSFINAQVPQQLQQRSSKGGKVKSSRDAWVEMQPQPSTSSKINQ